MTSRHHETSFLLPATGSHRVSPGALGLLLAGLVLGALATAAAPAGAAPYATPDSEPAEPEWSDSAYTYFRVVEGTATLFPINPDVEAADPAQAEEVVVQQPVLVGDRLTVNPGARLELVMSDGNLLRIEGPSELIFEALAGSPETEDVQTVLRLTVGEIQIVRLDDPATETSEPISIETPDTRIFLEQPGRYRVSTGGGDHGLTRVAVREGLAEMATDHGSILVRERDEALIEAGPQPRVAFSATGPEDGLERWGRRLWEEAAVAEAGPVDRSLRYSAAGLSDYGEWVHVGGQTAWRPRVEPDWRPYWSGRWAYTPSGYLWVSYEPWGWVPYHYGTWALDPGFGWVWFPGSRFAPAWVYWHWGSSHVAWVPIGYYSHYYAHHHHGYFGLRFGLYGFAGGLGHHFRHWLFADHHDFHHHDLRHHSHPWERFRDHHRWDRDGHRGDGRIRRDTVPGGREDFVPRGIVTTDSRGFGRGEGVPRRLALQRGEDLPDVSAFVAREPQLSPDLERRLVTRDPERRLAGTPLAPGTEAPRRLSARRPSPRTRSESPADRTSLQDTRRLTPRSSSPETPRSRALQPRATAPRRVTPRGETPGTQASPRRVTPRAEAPRTETPRSETRRETLRPRSARPGTVQPRAVRPESGRPQTVRPDTVRPRTVRPETVQPRAVRPDTVRPRTVRPQTVRPRSVTPRSSQPRSQQPRSLTPRTRRPATGRESGSEPSLRPRTARPGTAPRATVRPSPSRPSARSPSARTPSARRPVTRSPVTRRPVTGTSTRSPAPRRPALTPRSSSGVRRESPSSSRSTPRSSASSRSRPREGTPAPRARSGGGSSRSGSKATPRSGSSRGKAGASRGRRGGSRSRGGASRRGGG